MAEPTIAEKCNANGGDANGGKGGNANGGNAIAFDKESSSDVDPKATSIQESFFLNILVCYSKELPTSTANPYV